MLYRITARVVRHRQGWTSSTGLPTFYLESAIQGIISAQHAAEIADRMIRDLLGDAGGEVHLTAIDEDTREDYASIGG